MALWRKIRTAEDPEWTARYHSPDPNKKAFGGELTVTFADGSTMSRSIAVADAHPLGAHPFVREDYVAKFKSLADGILDVSEQARFLNAVQRLPSLSADGLGELNVQLPEGALAVNKNRGIF